MQCPIGKCWRPETTYGAYRRQRSRSTKHSPLTSEEWVNLDLGSKIYKVQRTTKYGKESHQVNIPLELTSCCLTLPPISKRERTNEGKRGEACALVKCLWSGVNNLGFEFDSWLLTEEIRVVHFFFFFFLGKKFFLDHFFRGKIHSKSHNLKFITLMIFFFSSFF